MGSMIQRRYDFKKNRILNLIRYADSGISRYDISKLTGYSIATISEIVSNLITDNFVISQVDPVSKVGRKPLNLYLNPRAGYFIGIEFNIQKMYCVVLNFVGEILYSSSVLVSYNPNTNGILKKMEEMITECLDFLGSNRVKVIGIGLGLPGYIDTANGIALNYVYIKDWKDIGIREYFETLFKIPCFIANNVDCMALAYKWLSRKGNAKDSIFISIRTGARLVPIINGFPYFGFNGSAGELGHIPLKGNNRSCSCGKKGCLNTIISDFSVINELKEKIEKGEFERLRKMVLEEKRKLSVELLVELALAGDKEAQEKIEEYAMVLGEVLITVINLFSPEEMIFSGALSKSGKYFLNPIQTLVEKHAVSTNVSHLTLLTSPFEDNIGAVGAATLVIEELFGEYDINL